MLRIIKDKLDALKELCKIYDVKTLYFFGSACTFNFFLS